MEFQTKKTSLFNKAEENQFVKAALKEAAKTTSGNGALKFNTSNNAFVDDFAAIANYKQPRSYQEVAQTMQLLWSINPRKCLQLAVYVRLITRETQVNVKGESETLEVQRGQGLKNEGIMRFLWLAINQRATFVANMPYFIAAGSWKDVFEMMSLDLQYHGWQGRKLDWNFLRSVIIAGLANPNTSELVKKYLPKIRSSKDCKTIESQAKTIIGSYLATCIYGKKTEDEEDSRRAQTQYRRLKSSGTAHEWQKLISQHRLLEIDFNTIHGRALSLLVGSKFLKNHNLIDKYQKWIASRPVAKYTGFVHELFQPMGTGYYPNILPEYQEITIDKQFNGLVETARKNMNTDSRLLVVRDISGSMTQIAKGTNMSSYAIGKAMALYFASLLSGPFENVYATFSDTCKMCKWQGKTVLDKWRRDTDSRFGSTNLLSVANLFVRLKNEVKVSESEFPNGALLISDGEFDYCGHDTSNFNKFRKILRDGGFSKEYVDNFKLILWDLPNGYYGNEIRPKFEDFADAPNNFYISGYDPSSVAFILGTEYHKAAPKNAIEMFNAAMDQDLLNRLKVINKSNKKVTKNKKK